MPEAPYRAGFAALVGRPNAGKSTLTNALVGEKVAITSSKPQTTRHVIRGVLTRPDAQLILVDTPGLHEGGARALNRAMNRTAATALVEPIEPRERGERRVVRGGAAGLAAFVVALDRLDALDRRHVERRREVVDDRIEDFLYTDIRKSRTTEKWEYVS